MSAKQPRQKVVHTHRSPMNVKRWVLTLLCGHTEWVTSNSYPTRKTATCHHCPPVEAPR